MIIARLTVTLAILLMIGCFGGRPGFEGPTYEPYSNEEAEQWYGLPVMEVYMDSCEPARMVLIDENGREYGFVFDSVLCEGYHVFGVHAVRQVIDTLDPPETVFVPVDTLGTGVYFYKTFTPTATKVESFMLLKKQ